MTETRRLRTAIIGTGLVAQGRYLPLMHKLAEWFDVRALCDTNATARSQAELVMPTACSYASLDDMLTDANMQVDCAILLASGDHQNLLTALADARIPTFTEKPLAYERESGQTLVDRFAHCGTILQLGYMKRYYDTTRRLQDVASRQFVTSLSVDLVHPPEDAYLIPTIGRTRPATSDLTTFLDSEAARPDLLEVFRRTGVGDDDRNTRRAYVLLATSAVHDINLLRAVAGTPTSVGFARFWNGGLCGQMIFEYSERLTASLTYNYVESAGYEETIRLIGPAERWTARFPSPYLPHAPATLTTVTGGDSGLPDMRHEQVSLVDPFEAQLISFHQYVANNRTPTIGGDEGVQDLALIESIIEAASVH